MRFFVVKRRDKIIKGAKEMISKMLKEYVQHRKIFCRIERKMGLINRCAQALVEHKRGVDFIKTEVKRWWEVHTYRLTGSNKALMLWRETYENYIGLFMMVYRQYHFENIDFYRKKLVYLKSKDPNSFLREEAPTIPTYFNVDKDFLEEFYIKQSSSILKGLDHGNSKHFMTQPNL